MDKLISRGAGIIVVNGWEYRDLVKKYAPSYPERIFLINDFPLTGIDNVISIVYGQHEGAFLAGALAGWMSRSGKIGFIGGMDMPVIRAFQTGFHEGARFAAPSIDITDIFLSSPEEQHSGFNNPNLGYTTAGRMFDNGVDIIFATAGLSGNGVIQAARDKQRFVIGVDADQDHLASGYVLTSVMKRLDLATADVLDKIFNKEKVQGVYYYGLEEAGVSLTPMTYTRKIIPTAILDKLAQLQQKIIDGEIRVTDVLRDRTPPAADSD
jgi:basic membrane protein A